MPFNLTEYIKRNLVNGYIDGTWTESKVSQLCVGYLDKGHLTVEDIAEVDSRIQQIKAEREAKLQEETLTDTEERMY